MNKILLILMTCFGMLVADVSPVLAHRGFRSHSHRGVGGWYLGKNIVRAGRVGRGIVRLNVHTGRFVVRGSLWLGRRAVVGTYRVGRAGVIGTYRVGRRVVWVGRRLVSLPFRIHVNRIGRRPIIFRRLAY